MQHWRIPQYEFDGQDDYNIFKRGNRKPMLQEVENEVNPEQEEKKRTRRKRNCEDQRHFKCNQCSKSYLSNAALYTHVKNKHENNNNKTGNKERSDGSNASNQEDDEPIVEEYKEENLQNLRHILKKYFPQRNKGCSIKQISEGLSIELQQLFVPLLTHWSENWDKPYIRQIVTVDQAIGQFLYLMNKRVSSMAMNFLLRVFYYVREGLLVITRNRDFCQKQTPMALPNHFNALIMRRLIPPDNVEEDELMNNSILVCKGLQFFGLWLYDEKYTDYLLKSNN